MLSEPAAAQTVEDPEYGDAYRDGAYGRVRYEEGGVAILRAETEQVGGERVEAGLNTPIFPGDTASTDPRQRLEVQLAQGSLVRLDRASQLTFLALPDPYAEFVDHAVLQLAEGALRLSASVAGEEEFRIDSPAASIYLLDDGDLRVEVDAHGRTSVVVRRGVAEVAASGGSVILRGGMRTEVQVGAAPNQPETFNTFDSDDFDRWVASREEVYRKVARTVPGNDETYGSLPSEVQPFYGELSDNGNWVETDDYGWVWTPESASTSWRPYYEGYWDYGPGGYFWVSSEPWGWAPYHYGRWAWTSGYGWAWVPGSVFGGAWVSWSWGPSYVGWSALDPWGYPTYYGAPYWGWYSPYTWVFVDFAFFDHHHHDHGCHGGHGHHQHYHDAGHVAHEIRDNAVVTRPPRESPADLTRSSEIRQRAVRETQTRQNLRPEGRAVATRDTSRRFDRVEDRLTQSGQRSPTAAADPARRAVATRSTAGPGRGVSSTVTPRSIAVAQPRSVGRPASIAPSGSTSARGSTVPQRGGMSAVPSRARSDSSSARGNPPQVQPRSSESTTRLRELYRNVATPRQTREAPPQAAQPSAPPQSTARRPVGARPATPRPSGTGQAAPLARSVAPPTRRPAVRQPSPPGRQPSTPQPSVNSATGRSPASPPARSAAPRSASGRSAATGSRRSGSPAGSSRGSGHRR